MTHNNRGTQHMSKGEQAGRNMRTLLLNSSSLVRSAAMVALGMASAAHAGDLPSQHLRR